MDSVFRGARLQRKLIFDFWRSAGPKNRLNKIIALVKSYFNSLELDEEQDNQLKAFLKKECEKIRLKWVQKRRRLDLFLNVYQGWLEEEIIFNMILIKYSSTKEVPGTSRGRPQKAFEESSSRTKKRKVETLLKSYDHEQLSFAAQLSVRATGKRDAADLIKEVSTASPRRATTYKKSRKLFSVEPEQRPYTADEALAMFVTNKFTVQQYKNIQQEAKERGYNLYPSYDQLVKMKKKCYPAVDNIIVTDISAEVNLQALVNHTARRICGDILEEVFSRPDLAVFNYSLIYKWGCDGSSGHSLYKQKFENLDSTDEYMFVLSLVPLRLITNDDDKKLIWQNPRPSSPRFCRVIKFIYKKETDRLIKEEYANMQKQIDKIVPTNVKIKDVTINVSHTLILSMIDGKVCNVLSETKSTQKCFICKVTAKDMNLDTIVNIPDERMYGFGISSLHAYIRTMECLLNICYRLDICQWQVRGKNNKEVVKKRKDAIKNKFKEIGLIIDKVKPGFGTSNDGNTARRFFTQFTETANITGVNENLIYRLSTILRGIASGYEIDSNKFEEYCVETRRLYIDLYPWYNMPVTLHKVLVHGAEIIRHSIIPIGQMSEEASEAKNKEIRKVRLGHSCKKSRVRTNTDILKYLLLSSDPYISLLRKLPNKIKHKNNKDLLSLLKDNT